MIKRSLTLIIVLISFALSAYAEDARSVVIIQKVDKGIANAVNDALKLAGDFPMKISKGDRTYIKISIEKQLKDPTGLVTNPEVVRQLIKIAKQRKARRVTVVEGVTEGNSYKAFELAGYTAMTKQEGAELKSLDSGLAWRSWVPDGSGYKKYLNSIDVLNCEQFINVPVLKYDPKTSVSLSLKNMIGIIYGKSQKRALLQDKNLDEVIVDLNMIRPTDIAIIDATTVIMQDGKTKKDLGVIIVSTDPVAADAVGAKILGFDPKDIRHLQIAEGKGLGKADLRDIEVIGESIDRLQRVLKD